MLIFEDILHQVYYSQHGAMIEKNCSTCGFIRIDHANVSLCPWFRGNDGRVIS